MKSNIIKITITLLMACVGGGCVWLGAMITKELFAAQWPTNNVGVVMVWICYVLIMVCIGTLAFAAVNLIKDVLTTKDF